MEQGPYDIELPVKMDDREYRIFVKVRPGTVTFLKEMAKHYEIVIFTASLSKYANPLMDLLDPETLCTARLFREHCRFIEDEKCYTKDMTLIGRKMEDIILIDNNAVSYKLQPENALPIISWYEDLSDTQLPDLTPLLVKLSKVHDVRDVLGHCHENHDLDLEKAL